MKGWMPPPPIRFLLNFSETNDHLHLPFSVAVRISLTHILTQDWLPADAMVTRNDVIFLKKNAFFCCCCLIMAHF